jgi:predicted RNase H-like HicB family nuclease
MYGFRLPFGPIIGIRNNEVSQMLRNYIQTAMRQAKYEILPDDGSFYGEIPSFDGVYANADKLEKCREELEEVLEEWILLRVSRNLPLPVVEGIELVIKETA